MPTPNSSTRLATATRILASKSDRDCHTASSAVATSVNASVNVGARNLHQDTVDLDLGMNPGISPGMMTEVSSTRRLAVRSRPMRRAVKRPPSPRKFRARPGSKTLTLNLQCRRQCGSAECSRTATQTQTTVMMARIFGESMRGGLSFLHFIWCHTLISIFVTHHLSFLSSQDV
jgi:hypothetical protein